VPLCSVVIVFGRRRVVRAQRKPFLAGQIESRFVSSFRISFSASTSASSSPIPRSADLDRVVSDRMAETTDPGMDHGDQPPATPLLRIRLHSCIVSFRGNVIQTRRAAQPESKTASQKGSAVLRPAHASSGYLTTSHARNRAVGFVTQKVVPQRYRAASPCSAARLLRTRVRDRIGMSPKRCEFPRFSHILTGKRR